MAEQPKGENTRPSPAPRTLPLPDHPVEAGATASPVIIPETMEATAGQKAAVRPAAVHRTVSQADQGLLDFHIIHLQRVDLRGLDFCCHRQPDARPRRPLEPRQGTLRP